MVQIANIINKDEFVLIKATVFFEFGPAMAQIRDEELIEKIVEKIKRLREQHGVTLEQFYNDTNIHLSRIESAKVNISISTLNMICKYFNLSLSEFLKGM